MDLRDDEREMRINLTDAAKSDLDSNIAASIFTGSNLSPNMPSSLCREREMTQVVIPSIRTTRWRWFTLWLISMIAVGGYYWYDMPNALSDKIKERLTHEGENDNEIRYNQFYSVYSYPNIILPLIAGVLVDKVGLYFSMLLFSGLDLLGQSVFTVAGYMSNDNKNDYFPYILALTGRFIYGLGGESLLVCQSTFVSKWFMEKELSLALGVVLCVCWIGSAISGYTIPPIAEATSLGFALNVGVMSCGFSFIIAIILIIFDKKASEIDKKNGHVYIQENERFHCKDIRDMSLIYWIIVINCIFTYSGMIFYNISNEFFQKRYGFTQIEAGRIGSNASVVSIIFAPIFGYIWDKYGHRISFTIISTSALTISHILFLTIPASKADNKTYLGIIPVGLMGLASSIYAAVLFPMIPLVVKPKILGSSYGLWSSLMNLGLALGPIMVGALTFPHLNENTYFWVNVSLCTFCAIGIICSIGLLIFNRINLNDEIISLVI